MKKIFYTALLFTSISIISCKSNDAGTQKIDFTQSYENAALALTTAQNNYNTALATKDATKITAARKVLETATNNYVNSKKNLIQSGGVVKQQYESKLVQSEQTLSNTNKPIVINNNSSDSVIGGRLGNKIQKNAQKIGKTTDAITNTTTGTIDKANKTVEDIAAKKAKAQNDMKQKSENFKKNLEDQKAKGKKLNDDLKNLFK